MRPVKIAPHYLKKAEGSALIVIGGTTVICAASVENQVPRFLRGSGQGWVTAEYGMLPRSTHTRTSRESTTGKVGGRTHEIKRLIGRSLRSVMNLDSLGERTIWVDCDVIEADGGTRTASITGAFVALALACAKLRDEGTLPSLPVREHLAAISAGVVGGGVMLDLAYSEDSSADVDMNLVVTESGRIVEIQGTAERDPFSWETLEEMVRLSRQGTEILIEAQKAALGDVVIDRVAT